MRKTDITPIESYTELRQQLDRIAAMAFALTQMLPQKTYEGDLCNMLHELASNRKHAYRLDAHFGIDWNADNAAEEVLRRIHGITTEGAHHG